MHVLPSPTSHAAQPVAWNPGRGLADSSAGYSHSSERLMAEPQDSGRFAGRIRRPLARCVWSMGWILVLLLSSGRCAADAGEVLAELEQRDWNGAPGLVYAVMLEGETIAAAAHGLANLEHQVPLARDSRMHSGSVAKPFMAYTILRLAEQGLLGLDDRLIDHLEGFEVDVSGITLRQLLLHSSGLRDYWSLSALAGRHSGDRHSQAAALALVRRQPELNFAPGSRHLYSNTGYLLLAEIVESVTGQGWDTWLAEQVFDPLGMASSLVVTDPSVVLQGLADSYRRVGDEGPRRHDFLREALMSGVYGSGNLVTTVDDLLRFADYLLRTEYEGVPLLDVLSEPAELPDGSRPPYGLGLGLGELEGWRTVHHGGAQAGYRAHLLLLPEAQLAVAVLANGGHLRAAPVAESLAQRALVEAGLLDERFAEVPESSPLHFVPADVAGLYLLDNGGVVKLRVVDGQLALLITGTGHALACREPDHCTLAGQVGAVTFQRGSDTAVTGLELLLGDTRLQGERREPARLTARELAGYAGDYYSSALAAGVTLVVEGQGLRLEQPTGGRVRLTPLAGDAFLEWETGDFMVRFDRDRRGRARRFAVWLERAWGVEFERL